MMPLSIKEIVEAVCGVCENIPEPGFITGVSTDSRKIKEGDLFIPLIGEKFDGHEYVGSALLNGAAFALSQRKLPFDRGVIFVEDTKKALLDLAMYYRSLFNVKAVGITGSVGKTTTKEMVASVLSKKYNVLKNEGNFNNEIGLPLTVFNLGKEHDVVVLEMGMNHYNEIHNLAYVARPDIGVITNIGVSHIENLGSREGILKAKSEMTDFMDEGSSLVLNSDDDILTAGSFKPGIKKYWYGISNKSGIYAKDIKPCGLSGISAVVCFSDGSEKEVLIPVPGRHMVYNALAAAKTGELLGLSPDEIIEGISGFKSQKMRMDIIHAQNGINIINDSYNANPVSMKAALDVLSEVSGLRIAVMGDMFELGEESRTMHYDTGKYAAECGIDIIVAIGAFAEMIYKGAVENGGKAYYFRTIEDFLRESKDIVKPQMTVLVKASRAMGFEEIANRLQGVIK
ncbi:MAG: UDP-N-acetylmuramoyl-tripeptide--D-alanyl-D-alanine ligase [Lachnospiraceae bacterium]|nr:UDP-N-acetylmuramoyl-tripeptide--D-alanyl-D-alanine ligase [Lachnospiraceae bacterium]